ncbi:mannose-1-phosphate guanylyltransferase [Novosphingobium marinum]|nr:sugar phosphate nucleotidyltransferase [Novosphingobium marinum]
MPTTVPVILCGGSGTRLWPRSRVDKPKPFLPLLGERTLFQETLLRCPEDQGFGAPLIVTGNQHLEHVEAQMDVAPGAKVIVEPEGKNTAAAIALAALRLPADAVMLVCPSDHHIGDPEAFVEAARTASEIASSGWLVAFGIEARSPETGFGYLKPAAPIAFGKGFRVYDFIEKPNLEKAKSFIEAGDYFWNGGIFAFTAGLFLEELGEYRPDMLAAARKAVEGGHEDGHRFHPDAAEFARIRGESVDYAVMENSRRAAMVKAFMAWSDIGNWNALKEARQAEDRANVVKGEADLIDCSNVFVETDGPRVSVVGLSDVIVVVDGDEVLVTSAEGAQKVGKLKGAANQ